MENVGLVEKKTEEKDSSLVCRRRQAPSEEKATSMRTGTFCPHLWLGGNAGRMCCGGDGSAGGSAGRCGWP